jgi:mRNA interferase MazF
LFDAGDVVTVDFPGVTGVKRRPAVVLSSPAYHTSRPDILVGLITSQAVPLGPMDYALQDWQAAGLRLPSTFRSYIATLPPSTNPVLIGRLSERDWSEVRGRVRMAFAGLTAPPPPPPGAPSP